MSMMIAARDLKARAAEILREVSNGQVVALTRRGRAVAEIRPLGRKSRKEDDVFGIWRDYDETKEVGEWVRASRRARTDRLRSSQSCL